MRNSYRMILALAALVVAPSAAEAQRARRVEVEPAYGNRFSLEPYAGAYNDAYDLSDAQTGFLFGMRLGYRLTSRARLLGNLGYAKTEDVAFSVAPGVAVYDNVWVLTTAGAEYDVIPGRTSASLGVEGGVGWRRTDLAEGDPAPGEDLSSDSFASYEVVAPALTLQHRLSTRAALRLSLQDYMFDVFEGPVDHSIALTLGIAFR